MLNPTKLDIQAKLIECNKTTNNELNIFIHGFSAFLNSKEEQDLIESIRVNVPDGNNILFRWNSGNLLETVTEAFKHNLVAHATQFNIYGFVISFLCSGIIDIIQTFKAHQKQANELSKLLIPSIENYIKNNQLVDVKVNFFAHSLGAALLVKSLLNLQKTPSFQINNISLLGGAVCSEKTDWALITQNLIGKLYNYYSTSDHVLRIKPDLEKNVGSHPIAIIDSHKIENIHFKDQSHFIYWSYLKEIYNYPLQQSKLITKQPNGEIIMYANDSNFEDEFNALKASIKKPNIFVLGGTGVGKSSLINTIFGKDVAAVGAGAPVTEGINHYSSDFYEIFDSEGYETGEEQQKRFKTIVMDFIKNREQSIKEQIHIAWYCISLANHRLFDIDISIVENIKKAGVPVAIVLTQADQCSDEESQLLTNEIQKHLPSIPIFESTTDKSMELTHDDLINWSLSSLDESLKMAFMVSISNKKIKREESTKIIIKYSGLAGVAGAIPIPFADAPIIIGLQMKMIAELATLWNIANIKSVMASGALSMIISQVGKSIAGNLTKLIPGAQIAGGIINASVASGLTAATGYAFTEVFEKFMTDAEKGINKNILDYIDSDSILDFIKQFMAKAQPSN